MQRRKFLQLGSMGVGAFAFSSFIKQNEQQQKPIVISTWDAGINANLGAWKVLGNGGTALDAVEQGVMVTENEINCCVGLGGNPDRDGFVTLDASIMDEHGNCGSVAFLERIKHPIRVARKVMEKTPHVFLVGDGAQKFAIAEGFELESGELSVSAKKEYEKWLKKNQYKPTINVEQQGHGPFAPSHLQNGALNHDTIGMLALDINGNLSGSCTTSGMAFKMRGRVGDSPIIGAGLFVDNEIGAAVATGLGEEVIKICGSHLVVQAMKYGATPEEACYEAIQKIIKRNGDKARELQVAFIALNRNGTVGSYAVQKGFSYALCDGDGKNRLIDGKHVL